MDVTHTLTLFDGSVEKLVSVDDQTLFAIKESCRNIKDIHAFFLQYSVFLASIKRFQKEMFYCALDSHHEDADNFLYTNKAHIEAEHLLTSQSVSFRKFVDFYPTLISRALAEDGIDEEEKRKLSMLYDNPNSYYCFLDALRNALTHSRVNIYVTRGASRLSLKNNIHLSKFGFFIKFDNFLKEQCKPNKRKILEKRRSLLTVNNGSVDVVRAFIETYAEIVNQVIQPRFDQLVEKFNQSKMAIVQTVIHASQDDSVKNAIEKGLLSINENDETLIDFIVVERILSAMSDTRFPTFHHTLTISPSYHG